MQTIPERRPGPTPTSRRRDPRLTGSATTPTGRAERRRSHRVEDHWRRRPVRGAPASSSSLASVGVSLHSEVNKVTTGPRASACARSSRLALEQGATPAHPPDDRLGQSCPCCTQRFNAVARMSRSYAKTAHLSRVNEPIERARGRHLTYSQASARHEPRSSE